MPYYDFRCPDGHEQEAQASRETETLVCSCGQLARRVINPAHVPSAIGFTPKPTREHYVHLNRAIEAQHEIIHEAEKHHLDPPDFFKIAQDRVRRGEVQAIT